MASQVMIRPEKESIPPLSHDGHLPPFFGGPTDIRGRAPYPATIEEFVAKFGFSARRREILDGLITLRRRYYLAGIRSGFQWLNGSFVANMKAEPGDIDVVTLFVNPYKNQNELLLKLAERGLHPSMRGAVKKKSSL